MEQKCRYCGTEDVHWVTQEDGLSTLMDNESCKPHGCNAFANALTAETARGMARLETWLAVWAMDVHEIERRGDGAYVQTRAWDALWRQCPQDEPAMSASAAGH